MNSIIGKHWSILSDTLKNIPEFNNVPRMVYRRTGNVKDLLFSADMGPETNLRQITFGSQWEGCYPCLHCNNSRHMVKGETFVHPTTGIRFYYYFFLSCCSDFVIYILSCPCGLLYIGETSMECRIRINKPNLTIRTKLLT